MAKKQNIEDKEVTVLYLSRKEGAYGYDQYSMPLSVLQSEGKLVDSPPADIFAIFLSQLTKKAREIFEI